jgi:hypothetical protein
VSTATKNQHFVSQAEQRLNAINPNARPQNQRIHAFDLVDRDRREIRLRSACGEAINTTLSMLDLFSFDIDGSGSRANFEAVFSHYEGRMNAATAQLLQAHAERDIAVGQLLFDLFCGKMLNFVRNPYSVAKVLNTFGAMARHHPADPMHYAAYQKILGGRRPQQRHICGQLGVTDAMYEAWLRVLFMLLAPLMPGGQNLFEDVLASLYENRDHALMVHVHTYTHERCLLSDRGYSTPIAESPHMAFDFNLGARAFVRYLFLNPETLLGHPVPSGVRRGLQQGPKQMQLAYETDDLEALKVFHWRIIDQAHTTVFSSGLTPYGVSVIGTPAAPANLIERL